MHGETHMTAVSGMGACVCVLQPLLFGHLLLPKTITLKTKNTSDVQFSVRYTCSNVSSYVTCHTVASGPGIFWEHTQSLVRIMSFLHLSYTHTQLLHQLLCLWTFHKLVSVYWMDSRVTQSCTVFFICVCK